MSSNDVSIVLVHGAWADGSSWAKVIQPFAADGLNVVAAPLPLTSFRDDVAALDRTLARVAGPVVLGGHAYAGTVIGAVRTEQVWALVYVAAFAQHASVEEQRLLAAVQRPISPACITASVGKPLWKDRPAMFLVAEEDRMIAPVTQHFMAARMKARVRSHRVDHTPIVTAPDVVVDVIREAVRDAAAGQ